MLIKKNHFSNSFFFLGKISLVLDLTISHSLLLTGERNLETLIPTSTSPPDAHALSEPVHGKKSTHLSIIIYKMGSDSLPSKFWTGGYCPNLDRLLLQLTVRICLEALIGISSG